MNEQEIKQKLRDWVLRKTENKKLEGFNDETKIIERRIISSVQLMDLIMFLEFLKDEPINVTQLKPGAFNSVNSIHESFFKN